MTTEVKEEFLNHYRSCHESLERFCRVLCRDREAARELVQETLLQALTGFDRLREKEKFLSWLMGIAIRVKRNQDRKLKNWVVMDMLPEKASTLQTDSDAALGVLRSLCRKLNEKEREVFLLFELSGLSLEAIAEVQESNVNTVKTRLRRARERLKKWLQHEYQSNDPLVNWSTLTLNMEAKENG
ncbi:MAG: RNA polymerase sigma factor [Bacteroidia bacterium]